ncbi:helix-turn-helix domain-containing protein [Lentilactobacillus parakefiri]|uniref:XRE family transcriptional regulator n=1 Tax=Lentilactobacillus parakefiri TaxID=152332 RepID=A0A224VIG3_9LACO|nr:helix-turn-helix transcriptional regulator [Lentilactobacillus parakefiri]TDG91690.1 hypothetical protein C5L28_000262 [Lentilactobacillus parakefiri]GAW72064.1 XRE family transcriptional regulator [Lentilactobacillus parakefiri]
MSNEVNIGEIIKAKRAKAKMTQETLAELAGISIDYLSKLETGKRTNLSATTLLKIAHALNTTTDSLLTGNSSNKNSELTLDAQEQLLLKRLHTLNKESRADLIHAFMELIHVVNKQQNNPRMK